MSGVIVPDSDPRRRAKEPTVLVTDPRWRRLVRRPELLAQRCLAAASVHASVVLATDAVLKRLNARHRGRARATNVLAFPSALPGVAGQILLAVGTVAREAGKRGLRPGQHLAHLVLHGALHLAGHDHHHAGEARRMEQAEARLLARLRVPNPWKG